METGIQVTQKIPPEVYYMVGTLLITNIGAIASTFWGVVKFAVRFALLEQKLTSVEMSVNEIKIDLTAELHTAQKDLDHAHVKIREIERRMNG